MAPLSSIDEVGHLAAAGAHRLEGGLEGQGAGGDQRAVLAEAVAHDDVGGDAVGGEQPGEGDVGGQHGGLGDLGLQQLLLEPGDGLGVGPVDEDEVGERLAQQRRHDPSASAKVSATIGSLLAQVFEHVDVLRALAGVEEGDLARLGPGRGTRPGPAAPATSPGCRSRAPAAARPALSASSAASP